MLRLCSPLCVRKPLTAVDVLCATNRTRYANRVRRWCNSILVGWVFLYATDTLSRCMTRVFCVLALFPSCRFIFVSPTWFLFSFSVADGFILSPLPPAVVCFAVSINRLGRLSCQL